MLRVMTFVLAMLAATYNCWANALTPEDQQRFENFLRKAQTVRQDVAASAGSCLLEPTNAFLDDMTSLYALVAIDVAMVDQRDEMMVQYYLQDEIRAFRGIIDDQEQLINQSLGVCASSEAVAAKGQDLLRLLDDASSLVEGISRKLGR
jgi:hypothetical protein